MQLVQETREDHKRGLAVEILRSGGSVHLQAWGTSMLPSIWPGDLLTIEGRNQIRLGDMVLLGRADRFFIHRVVERLGFEHEHQWITRGDCAPSDDPPVVHGEVLGTVSAIQREGCNIIPTTKLSRTRRLVAWMLCHCDFLRGFALRVHAVRQEPAAVDVSLTKSSAEGQHF
jgi:peptidase S24-like protein